MTDNTAEPTPHTSTPPPLPPTQETTPDTQSTYMRFLLSYFWWIISAAALIKIISYFIAPQPPSTIAGHIGGVTRGLVIFGVILSAVSLSISWVFKKKVSLFRLVFVSLFSLACALNLPTSLVTRYAYAQVRRASLDFLRPYAPEKNDRGSSINQSKVANPYEVYIRKEKRISDFDWRLTQVNIKLADIGYNVTLEDRLPIFSAIKFLPANILEKTSPVLLQEMLVGEANLVRAIIGSEFPAFCEYQGGKGLIIVFRIGSGSGKAFASYTAGQFEFEQAYNLFRLGATE